MSDKSNSKGPIFIIGAARSGTTLLQYMLRSHPDLSLPTAESHFFIPIYNRRNEFGDLTKQTNLRNLLREIYNTKSIFFDEDVHGIEFDINTLTSLLHKQGRATVPSVISGIFEANAEGEGKNRWGDKTPYYILHLEILLEMFPNAQFVHLIRDGRDCALSMLERSKDLKIVNIYHAAYTWNKYVEAGCTFGRNHPNCYFGIRYEDILNKPEEAMHSLCTFLSIAYNDSIINFKKSDGSGKTPLLTKPLQKSNQAKWKSNMTKKKLSVFESLAGKTLYENGYELACKDPHIPLLSWLFYESHIKYSHFLNKYRFTN